MIYASKNLAYYNKKGYSLMQEFLKISENREVGAHELACHIVQPLRFVELAEGSPTREQVTRGHHIVADGWAGASNPQSQPTSTPNPQ